MQFHYTPPQTELEKMLGGYFCINAIGKIRPGDDQSFKLFLQSAEPPPRCVVYIDSSGGDVDAAIGIGHLIRSSWFATDVGQCQLDFQSPNSIPLMHRKKLPGQCLSAATLVFLGGRLRYFDGRSKFGVHQFDFPQAQGEEIPRNYLAHSQTLSAKMFEYIVDMGISPQFLLLSVATPSDQMRFVSHEELERIGAVTGGQTDVNWSIEGKNGLSYVKGERDSLYGHHKVMLGFNNEIGFVIWAVMETQGRARELLGFSLVEVVLNGESKRLDISSRAERKEEGIYTNILARISEDEAKQIAFSDSFGVQIRFSSDASMFLGIAAMDTKEGQEKLRTFFTNHKK
jgi:hypothetical protein